jgi:methionyl aminopeptidase
MTEIELKSSEEIEKMSRASRIVAEVLAALRHQIKPGMTTEELDRFAEKFILERGGKPAFKGYQVRDKIYQHTLCVSVNDEVVHGIPSSRVLTEGDIVGLDIGVVVDGYYGDAAITVPVGAISDGARRLLQVTEEALHRGIAQAIVGNRISDISHAVQSHAEGANFSVVTEFVGHGIGRRLHEEPQVPNYGEPGKGPRLRPGMTLAIEPMVNMGRPETRLLADGWTAVTRDRSLSAHFEHTIVVTDAGPRILTKLSETE